MTIHRSLKIQGNLLRSRNVWTRIERLEALRKAGEWEPGEPVFGLRKVRTTVKAKKAKKSKKEEKEEQAEGASGE